MLFEKFFRLIEELSVACCCPDSFDVGRFDGFSFVAPAVSRIGQNGGDLFIVKHSAYCGHRRNALAGIVSLAVHGDFSPEAMKGELDEALLVSCDPLALCDRGVDIL